MAGWAYMLRCSDGSLYVGSTSHDDISIRVAEHNDGKYGGYTAQLRPVTLVWCEHYQDLRDAHAMERQLKGWRREKKMALICGETAALPELAKRPGARRPSWPAPGKR
jgi:predicted GIY-YIG superfamily endonuclease